MRELRAESGEAGFTLIELIVSIALLGMLTTALFTGISFGTRAWKKAEDASSALTQISAAQILLHDLLSRVYPLMIRAEGQGGRVDFDGTSTSISFLTHAPPDIAPGGFARITLKLEQDATGSSLIYGARPELALTDHPARKRLLRGVRTLAFSYLGSDDSSQPGQWLSAWHNRTRLPALIRVQATLAGPNAPSWPDLSIRPRIAADAGCSFDVLTKSCKGY